MLSALRRASAEAASPLPTGIVVTDSNLNPILQMITWLLLALTALMLCFRFLTKFFLRTNQRFGWEEVFITSAFLSGVGESVTFLVPAGTIFGKDSGDISGAELTAGLKVQYVGELLFILTLGLAKLSVCAGFTALSLDTEHRRLTSIFASVSIAWTVVAFVGTAFQCGASGPWEGGDLQCLDKHAFLYYVTISNIITDIALILLPVAVILPLNIDFRARVVVLSFFSVRILAIIATAFQMTYIPRLFEDNFTLRSFPYYLSAQFVQFASISAACAAYLWPFLRSLRSGLFAADKTGFPSPYALSKLNKGVRKDADVDMSAGNSSRNRDRSNYIKITTDNTVTTSTRSHESKPHEPIGTEAYMKGW
ncbi:hypothetical protein GGS23DRAFT_598643 [Durotheca rogersii]|uniref:uncharacterized protein n=1 Tax=Durotheca rogersii TaxID=419775 RepID=UPI00221F6283|nr:uncharacterized protein GGS23DRAFT_598643 [Durotheca rogersii]KAI5861115.1 hypothetical protein GGS23DRAFT_598643 [Durotheca rogersii]